MTTLQAAAAVGRGSPYAGTNRIKFTGLLLSTRCVHPGAATTLAERAPLHVDSGDSPCEQPWPHGFEDVAFQSTSSLRVEMPIA